MSDFADEERSVRKDGTRTAAIVSGLMAAVGGFYFMKGYAYLDIGHLVIVPVFFMALSGVFFSLRKYNLGGGIIFVLCVVASVYVFSKKTEWQADYVKATRSGTQPYVFEPYVERYPLWEEYMLADLIKKPNWVKFNNECARPALENKAVDGSCKSLEAIAKNYNIDMRATLQEYLKRMQYTAEQIQKNKINTVKKYQTCLETKKCAEVPLLPDKIDPDDVDPQSLDYIEVRRPFWQLVNSKEITPEICGYMVLCNVLMKTGAVAYAGRN